MKYSIYFSGEADADIDALFFSDKKLFSRIINKIESLENNPKAGKALVGTHKGEYSLRVGNYRIVYQVNSTKHLIYILTIKHRKHVY